MKVRKTGNALAVTIPADLCAKMNLTQGDFVEIVCYHHTLSEPYLKVMRVTTSKNKGKK